LLSGQANEKGFVSVGIATVLDEVLERCKTAVVIHCCTLTEPGFDDFLILALQRGSQQQIKQAEENRRTEHEQRCVADAQTKRETSRQMFKRV
jgi:hypothetical protein